VRHQRDVRFVRRPAEDVDLRGRHRPARRARPLHPLGYGDGDTGGEGGHDSIVAGRRRAGIGESPASYVADY